MFLHNKSKNIQNGCEVEVSDDTGTIQDVTEKSLAHVEDADVDDDENIFSDVSESLPIDRLDDRPAELFKKERIEMTGYFSNLSAAITGKENAARKQEEETERAWKEALQQVVKMQKKIDYEKKRKAQEMKMTGEADDYAEYQGTSGLADSDGEDDEETTRRRKAAGCKTKANSDVEEKVFRKKQKQTSRLANDLEKVNQIMKDKSYS